MGMLATGLAWLNEQLAEHARVEMTFIRKSGGVVSSVTVLVTPTTPESPPITPGGAPINPSVFERDIIVRLTDLADVLGTTMPSERDVFVETIGGRTLVYKITQPAMGGPRYEWVSGDRGPEALIRIHTKLSGIVTGYIGPLTLGAMTVAGSGTVS